MFGYNLNIRHLWFLGWLSYSVPLWVPLASASSDTLGCQHQVER